MTAKPAAPTGGAPTEAVSDEVAQAMEPWMAVAERAQMMMAGFWANAAGQPPGERTGGAWPVAAAKADPGPAPMVVDPAAMMRAGAAFWAEGLKVWQSWLAGGTAGGAASPEADKRFKAPEWRAPMFDAVARNYLAVSERLIAGADGATGLDPEQHEKLKFAVRAFVDAASPSNFPLTNPQVLRRTVETRGDNLLKGLEHMLRDLGARQMTHVEPGAFAVGRNLAMTPGKVIKETPLYQLIHYAPTTDSVHETPLVIFPPWINRFYILDLTPEKSFVRWAVGQGLSVFMVSWKSADASMRDTGFDDYVLRGQVDAIDTVRALLDVPAVHTIGYCVAGTTLAATLALLTARGEADKVATATFFTAQVDFEDAGELKLFLSDGAGGKDWRSARDGFTDGRTMAATFNALRGRDLIWNYHVNNYLLGEDYKSFDLLHWNGDTTNLPAAWHADYLQTFYRANKLATGGVTVDGTAIDLNTVATPSYVQAGKEDHIAPARSVYKIRSHFTGPLRFVLAGSGHIAGVVNPPDANKYGYWLNDAPAETLDQFVAGATQHRGSWWPDWMAWLAPQSGEQVLVAGARVPGEGALPAIENAPGRYVSSR